MKERQGVGRHNLFENIEGRDKKMFKKNWPPQ
jgi:hypothetical protein